MKYRALANGNEIELSDEAAAVLVPTIYEPVEEKKPEPKPLPVRKSQR